MYLGEYQQRCSGETLNKKTGKMESCNRLLFTVSQPMFWCSKLTVNIMCPKCGKINHITHHDFTGNTKQGECQNVMV